MANALVQASAAPALDASVLQTLDAAALDDVVGGFAWAEVGRSALSGLLSGAAQDVQSGTFLKGALSGGIMGLAQGLVGQINQPSQAAAAPEAQQPQAATAQAPAAAQ
jgi:hypothetical protein